MKVLKRWWRSPTETERRLGYRFSDPPLLERALTHRSCAFERRARRGEDYERLEFLGDAILGFVVSEWLCGDDPAAREGVLTRRKQAVVRTEALARAARRIGLGEALYLGRGEDRAGGRDRTSILADAFEAVVGAVHVDGGIRSARAFVKRHLGEEFRVACGKSEDAEDFKTRLQETVQGAVRQTPRYRLVGSRGPGHAMEFDAEVVVGSDTLGRGTGASRKQAEQEAARDALERIERGEGVR